MEDENGHIITKNLSVHRVTTEEEALNLVRSSLQNRQWTWFDRHVAFHEGVEVCLLK